MHIKKYFSQSFNFSCAVLSLSIIFFSSQAYSENITLAWDASGSTDISYNIHYGTASGSYNQTHNAANNTSYVINDLSEGATYYFAVTAYDKNDPSNESTYSIEKSYTVSSSTTDTSGSSDNSGSSDTSGSSSSSDISTDSSSSSTSDSSTDSNSSSTSDSTTDSNSSSTSDSTTDSGSSSTSDSNSSNSSDATTDNNNASVFDQDDVPDNTYPVNNADDTNSNDDDITCMSDNDCDDGVFCNGQELCSDGTCFAGISECSENQICKENKDECRDALIIKVENLIKKIRRPHYKEKRFQWLILQSDENIDFVNTQTSISVENTNDEFSGIEVDSTKRPVKIGQFIFIPIIVWKEAQLGQCTLKIESEINEDYYSYDRIILTSLKIS